MAKYEFTDNQVENLRCLILDANIKGSAAQAICELVSILENPVQVETDDLHSEHNDGSEKAKDEP